MERFVGVHGDSCEGKGRNGHRLTEARLSDPTAASADSQHGRLWISEYETHCLKLVKDDMLTTYAGTGDEGYTDGPIALCNFSLPQSLHYIPHANTLLICESVSSHVRIIDCTTEMIRTIAINEFVPNLFHTSAKLHDTHPFDSFMPKYTVAHAKELIKTNRAMTPSHTDFEMSLSDFVYKGTSTVTWAQEIDHGATWALDWSNGDCLKADLTFNPMASFGRNFLLAERNLDERWLAIAKTLPNGDLVPNSTRRLCELFASAREFSISSNTLYTTKDDKHYIKPHLVLPHPLLERHSSHQIDFTPLLNSTLASDFQLVNNASGMSWDLHLAVLYHCGLHGKTEKLRQVVAHSSLPSSSIDLFINFILQKCLYIEYNQRQPEEWIEVISLCKEAGIECSTLHFILRDNLQTLTGVAGIDRILNILNKPINPFDITARKILAFRANRLKEINRVTLATRTSGSHQIAEFITSLSLDNEQSLNLELKPVERHGSTELICIRDVSNPASLVLEPTDFAFSCRQNEFIVAKGWLLYVQWRWFAGLVHSGFYESRTRIINMAASLTPKVLMAILRAAHAPQTRQLDDLDLEDCQIVLSHALMLGLVDMDDVPIGCFKPLIERCRYQTQIFAV